MYNIEIKDKSINNTKILGHLVIDSIYSFVSKLPYSMDPLNDDYIPADLYNHQIVARELLKKSCSDNEMTSLFFELQTWGDTRKTSYVIQLCYVFQQMLCDNIKKSINEEDEVFIWGVS